MEPVLAVEPKIDERGERVIWLAPAGLQQAVHLARSRREAQRRDLESGGQQMIPRKPKFDLRTREDIALYSTADLRRVWREDWISWLTLLAAVIGAAGAIVAVVEGWPK
jgi:hypothetical protein